jgi:hypothetical protein
MIRCSLESTRRLDLFLGIRQREEMVPVEEKEMVGKMRNWLTIDDVASLASSAVRPPSGLDIMVKAFRPRRSHHLLEPKIPLS